MLFRLNSAFMAACDPFDVHFARNSPFGVRLETVFYFIFTFLSFGLVHFFPVFHARHCRVPSKVPNGPSSRILLAARSSSTSFHARLFDSVVRFGASAGGAARLWCSTTIFFAKIYQFRVGFGNLYREAPFPRLGVVSCPRCSRARHFARHIC